MKITRDDDFGGALLNCAVRYALGRCSYMPSLVMRELRPMLKDCSTKTLRVFKQDIQEFVRDHDEETMHKQDSMFYDDYYEWLSFLGEVEEELNNRT